VVEDFQETILILEPMKTVQRLHKRKKKQKRKTGNKTTDWKFDFQRAKEYQKIEKKGFRSSKNCTRAIVHGRKITG
jgi:hypothetical protein